MKEIKALVLCSTRFAMPSIQQLWYMNILKAVVIPAGADDAAEYAEALLQESDIPVIILSNDDPEQELIDLIGEYDINLALMFMFKLKIPAAVYTLPSLGFYNFHPGPLPQYRGADPVFQQIKRMEPYAGITIHKTDEGFDTGAVIIQERIKISIDDTHGTLTGKLSIMASKMLGVLIKMLSMDIVPPEKVQDNKAATHYRKQALNEVTISWASMTADEIIALCRACNPWNKGAATQINNLIIRLPEGKKTTAGDLQTFTPGTVISISEHGLLVAAINNEAVSFPFIYLEEGFMSSGKLSSFGLIPGSRFNELK